MMPINIIIPAVLTWLAGWLLVGTVVCAVKKDKAIWLMVPPVAALFYLSINLIGR